MSFNGSGTFVINSAGQPVVTGTTIASTAFNSLTADLATGLSTTLTKDGQSTPTANIPMGTFKITGLGNGTASTDAINLGQAQGAFVGSSYTTTATAAGTTTLTVASNPNQYFTGVTTQTVVLPVASTMTALGQQFRIDNLSTGSLTVNSSGGNLVATVTANQQVTLTCILLTGTDALSWDVKFSGATSITGTGSTVRSASPTFTGTAVANLINAGDGLVSAPSLSFVNATGCGPYKIGTNNIGWAANGAKVVDFAATGEINYPLQSAFLAYSASNTDVTGDGTNFIVTFATEIIDQNSDFSSPTFTAPKTGVYLLGAAGGLAGMSAAFTQRVVTIVTGNRTYTTVQDNAGAVLYAAGTSIQSPYGTVLADMDAADTAQLKILIANSTKTVDLQDTYFFGGLMW